MHVGLRKQNEEYMIDSKIDLSYPGFFSLSFWKQSIFISLTEKMDMIKFNWMDIDRM